MGINEEFLFGDEYEKAFEAFFAELEKNTEKEFTCCDDIINQEIAESGFVVCTKCGVELRDQVWFGKVENHKVYEDYSRPYRYKPYIAINNIRKKVRYALGIQRVRYYSDLAEKTKNCKDLEQVKKVFRENGATKQYKNAYLYLKCGKVPEWLLDLIFTIIHHVLKEYREHKRNKKKIFPFIFMARECTLFIMKYFHIDLSNYLNKHFPRMKTPKSELANLLIWIQCFSEVNFTLLDMDMRRILVTHPEVIREIANQNSYQLDPYSAELEDSRLSIINSFEDYKMDEYDRISRLSAPQLPLRLMAPEEKAKNLIDRAGYAASDSEVDKSTSKNVQQQSEPTGHEPIIDGSTIKPIKNIEVVDPGFIIPKNSIASIRATVEQIKALHSKEKEQRIILQKAKELVNRNV